MLRATGHPLGRAARSARIRARPGRPHLHGPRPRGLENPTQLAPVLGAIGDRIAAHSHPPLYLSLDIDCLDPAFAPGTGTPEPGGLTTNQVLTLLEELAPLPFVGMDCVEVAPPYNHAELTSYAAANFVWTYLCGRLEQGTA